jgi:dTDP-4-amino-4,6-dideoxygalactose transaminase
MIDTKEGAIPFVDLVALHQEIRSELIEVFEATIDTAGFVGGPAVEKFEREFAAYCDSKYCVGVNSGTDALRFALTAAGVQSGDIVITVPHTFIATTEAISQAGALPEFVDIDARTYSMDPEELRRYLETQCDFDPRTGRCIHRASRKPVTAVVPVHLYGLSADMDPILALAKRYNLLVVEDACQAHGAEYFSAKENRWRKIGSMGNAAAFSFYPGKNLGACGEGGAITTNDKEIGRKSRMLREHGQSTKYYHDIEGYNGRLDSLQAGILSVKLKHLTEWNRLRHEAAKRYDALFNACADQVVLPYEPKWGKAVYHLYVARFSNRDEVQKYLASQNIGTGIHYPVPLHLQVAYQSRGFKKGDYPVTEKAAATILSLPMFPQLEAEHQNRVAQAVLNATGVQAIS